MCYEVEARTRSIAQFFPPKNNGPQQLLNGQRMLRMPGLSSFSFRRSFSFGSFNISSLNGKSMKLCEELLKREVGIYCIQEKKVERYGFKIIRV